MQFQGFLQVGLGCTVAVLVSCASTAPTPKSEVSALQAGTSWVQDLEVGKINPLYMQTQADFHFAKGEALSLEGRQLLALKEFRTALIYDNSSTALRTRLAKEYIRLGLYGEALKEAQFVVKKDPANVEARLLLGGLYSTLKLYAPAQEEYEAVLELEPANQRALHYQGALLLDQERFEEAREYFAKLSRNEDYEEPHKAYFYLAKLEQLSGDTEGLKKSVVHLRKALALHSRFFEGTLLLGKTLERLEDNTGAVKVYRSYLADHGPSGQILESLGELLLKIGRTQEALTAYLELEQVEPLNQSAALRIAFILVEQGSFEGAAQRLERLVLTVPDADKVRFYLGALYEEMKDFASARRHFGQIPPESSYFAESVLHISYLHKLEGNLQGALKTLKEAMPFVKEARVVLLYASYLEEERRLDEAIAHLEQSKEEFPEAPDLFYFLGSLWEQKGHADKSIRYLETVLELEPQHVQALNHLAYTLAERGEDLERAERFARNANELQPSDGYILDTLGWVLYKQGRYEDSVVYLERAFRKASHESIIAEHLGDAYVKTQLPEKAIEMYAKAYETQQSAEGREKIEQKMSQVRHTLEVIGERAPASRP